MARGSEPFLASLSLFQPPAFSVSVHGNSVPLPLPSSDPACGWISATFHDGKFPGAKHQGSHTSDLLYASLLMSLLAAFVAMPGKQRLNRYLRHTGGSMAERCHQQVVANRVLIYHGLRNWQVHIFNYNAL